MSYLSGIWLAVLGIMAAPNLVIAKKPEAKEILDKLVPYQGWFGAVSAVYGVIDIIRFLGRLDWFEYIPIGMITFIVGAVVTLALGLLLGIGVIKSFVSSAEAKAKMDEMIAKLAPKQGTLGLLGIIVGLWIIIYRLAGLTL
ncbi:MAG: hypothetical protein JXA64_06770 [Candidatus Fermentibacteraceae bacterium]|nr:hypothetical protein [Candidatus Fermentibacteraceae bacterium]MBN2608801.1 hypothetical protein [Candidatus Fermentibacteraceae bacterium]